MEKLSLQAQESQLNKNRIVKRYQKSIFYKILSGLLLIAILLSVFIYSLSSGSIKISFIEILKALFAGNENSYILYNIRLPRSIGAILAGASLGLAGCVMQNILKNPLASPFTLGISHGAAFGAAMAIIFFNAGTAHSFGNESVTFFNSYFVAISAFVGAILSTIIILGLSLYKNISPEAVVLSGVAIGSLFNAATMFIQYFAADFQVSATIFWTFGDIGKAGWSENAIIAIAFILSFIWFYFQRWNFNALLWGDETAKSLGVSVTSLRLISMLLCAILISICTAFLGIIGFVGLISPHIVRMFIGTDYRFLIPLSTIFGSLLLLISDLIAKTILEPVILPVGIITSLLGAPLFFYMLIKRRRV
ncbi:MAG TPA: iron ABC transporter permease [Spirochaetota bacterium]|jgi:iron complex transport system permease protein|nr:iron ABC transporter permease [Spirochaetota bacterium]HPD78450.1 iron ABC transporter permease [Spirochaetota bacterium]HRS63163.1 iron ABC transporter permease [Spirochaetota bacterium]